MEGRALLGLEGWRQFDQGAGWGSHPLVSVIFEINPFDT